MIIMALSLLLDQAPIVGLEQDRKAFEPYRQCVLAAARQQYPTGKSLRVIFEGSQKSCVAEQASVSADIALNAAQRAVDAAMLGGQPSDQEYRFGLFENELLYELANDFVPKVK
jgi:hypothetical protein